MFNIGKAKEKASAFARSMSARDNLQRAATIAIGAVYADGDASNKELETARTLVTNLFRDNAKIAPRDIATALDGAEAVFKSSRFTAMNELKRACETIETPDEAEGLFAIAGDVCVAEGDIGDKEMDYLKRVGTMLRVDLKQYGLA